MASPPSPGVDGPASDALLSLGKFFSRWEESADGRVAFRKGGRAGDVFYRDRWSHDKVVRSTHGVNCTGSCSWKVYVRDGIITWEAQQTDYPSVGPDRPEYEPRGCPRGAAFSWYTYSPTRVRYPYVRGVLLEMYREAKARLHDPVLAWADVVGDPERRRRYQRARGKGGLVRASWQEAVEIAAAAHVHTIKTYGPDRCTGFSPIPAMSMVSHCVGTRFTQLIGGVMTSFYDWYADLPVASPQVFGDQTDVPESGDWWDATYLMMWGSNVPVTRTPDAHWMAEVRYRGTKVVTVSPDYADNTKFADEWLPAQAGTDAALAMAMGHVILNEFFVDRRVPFFVDYVRQYTDLPFLITLTGPGRRAPDGGLVPGKFLTAEDLGTDGTATSAEDAWKTVLLDAATGGRRCRTALWASATPSRVKGSGTWISRASTRRCPCADARSPRRRPRCCCRASIRPSGEGGVLRRGVPVARAGRPAGHHRVRPDAGPVRRGPGRPSGRVADRATTTPPARTPRPGRRRSPASRPRRASGSPGSSPTTPRSPRGRSMIIMGAGICQWFHADATYRSILSLLVTDRLRWVATAAAGPTTSARRSADPITGWISLANGLDWARPPRTMIGTAFWYMHTDQWRYDGYQADALASPLAEGSFTACTPPTRSPSRPGWVGCRSTRSSTRTPLDLADEAGPRRRRRGARRGDVRGGPTEGRRPDPSIDDVDAPENWPRTLTLWRSNLMGSSAKGNEYFLKHLLGTHSNVMATEGGEDVRPRDVTWREDAPEGKLDLLLSADFRMTSTTLLSDIVLPAATWYEKYDLSSTDMHPFVHAFTPAIDPPWEARSDFDIFHLIAQELSKQAETHLGTGKIWSRVPLLHDTPGEMAQPGGIVRDWAPARSAVPGQTMPELQLVERDYTAIADKLARIGPLAEKLGFTGQGSDVKPAWRSSSSPRPNRAA